MRSYPTSKVFLGFNRPRSVLMKSLVKQLASQSGPLMINWFIVGHEIPDDHWYFLESEGGRILEIYVIGLIVLFNWLALTKPFLVRCILLLRLMPNRILFSLLFLLISLVQLYHFLRRGIPLKGFGKL